MSATLPSNVVVDNSSATSGRHLLGTCYPANVNGVSCGCCGRAIRGRAPWGLCRGRQQAQTHPTHITASGRHACCALTRCAVCRTAAGKGATKQSGSSWLPLSGPNPLSQNTLLCRRLWRMSALTPLAPPPTPTLRSSATLQIPAATTARPSPAPSAPSVTHGTATASTSPLVTVSAARSAAASRRPRLCRQAGLGQMPLRTACSGSKPRLPSWPGTLFQGSSWLGVN